ncbi:hypothetical protein [Streptomyces sp. NPDC050145]|uniref:hypothetical protein n=1 Tax=Streptomyces sp. NPDC050145 TaxID=3365602 RepID=UPI0037BA9E82
MTRLDDARTAAREYLKLMIGDAWPEWRTCYSTDGTEMPSGIAPVCPDEGHEEDDGTVYNCCPEPVLEVETYPLAEYLVALLNSDRPGGAE